MKSWNLHIVGSGPIEAARNVLTTMAAKLRDRGLNVDRVEVTDGQYLDDLRNADPQAEGATGWLMTASGTGDATVAYSEFPGFLEQFREAGLEVHDSGIVQGARTEIPIPA